MLKLAGHTHTQSHTQSHSHTHTHACSVPTAEAQLLSFGITWRESLARASRLKSEEASGSGVAIKR